MGWLVGAFALAASGCPDDPVEAVGDESSSGMVTMTTAGNTMTGNTMTAGTMTMTGEPSTDSGAPDTSTTGLDDTGPGGESTAGPDTGEGTTAAVASTGEATTSGGMAESSGEGTTTSGGDATTSGGMAESTDGGGSTTGEGTSTGAGESTGGGTTTGGFGSSGGESTGGGSTDGGSTGGASTGGASTSEGSTGGASTSGGSTGGTGDPFAVRDCSEYCTMMSAVCDAEKPQYFNATACLNVCATFEVGETTDPAGGDVVGGTDTLACRAYHLGAADSSGNPVLHCPHAGPAGENVCGDKDVAFCTLQAALCFDTNEVYPSVGDCLADVPNMPMGGGTYDATQTNTDTFNCRIYHLTAAGFNANTHCSHTAGPNAPGGNSPVCTM